MIRRELHLRLNEEESIELYIALIDAIRKDERRQLPGEIYEIVGKLQRRLADYEIIEYVRLYGFLTCRRCETSGFREKALLVRHVETCYGVTIAEALTIVHNLYRPALILRGR